MYDCNPCCLFLLACLLLACFGRLRSCLLCWQNSEDGDEWAIEKDDSGPDSLPHAATWYLDHFDAICVLEGLDHAVSSS